LRIYLDSAPVIYAIQSVEPFLPSVSRWIGRPDAVLVVSDQTRLECRVLPIRNGNSLLLEAYDEFFGTGVKEIVPLSAGVVDRATAIRAQYGYGVADSLHLAAALSSVCDVFLTNDRRLLGFGEISVEILAAS
jgi:predicted nucleic acid-binding protein